MNLTFVCFERRAVVIGIKIHVVDETGFKKVMPNATATAQIKLAGQAKDRVKNQGKQTNKDGHADWQKWRRKTSVFDSYPFEIEQGVLVGRDVVFFR